MIKIKMYDGKWQIIVGDEVWQFKNDTDFANALEKLLIIKATYGKIK